MFIKKLNEIATQDGIKATEKSINQTQRNNLVQEITTELLKSIVEDRTAEDGIYQIGDYISVGRTDSKTIEFAIDNEYTGIIPLTLSVSIPNFSDEDLIDRTADYKLKVEMKLKKKEEEAKAKAEKIARDKERREKIKALKESQ